MRKTKEYTLKRTKLNNKTRKGEYIYIKEKGQPGKYYKHQPGTMIDTYLEWHKKKTSKQKPAQKRKAFSEWIRKRNKDIQENKIKTWKYHGTWKRNKKTRTYTLSDGISKGLKKTTIPNLLQSTHDQENKAIRELLKPLVLDPKLLDILCLEENQNKLRTRFSIMANLNGEKNEILASITHIGMKTPREAIAELKRTLKEGMEVKEGSPTIKKVVNLMGYQYQGRQDGKLKSVTLTMQFAKAK